MTYMFDKIKTLFNLGEKVETVPQDADENWEPANYNAEVDPYGNGHPEEALPNG
jgi:hypothetical protein